MGSTKNRLARSLLCALLCGSSACVTVSNPGQYLPRRPSGEAGPRVPLRVVLQPFRWGAGGTAEGKEMSAERLKSHLPRTPETERLTASFARDLGEAQIFSGLEIAETGGELILEGELLKLRQPGPTKVGSSGGGGDGYALVILATALVIYGVGIPFGAPTDWGEGEAALVVRARDPEYGQVLKQWEGKARCYALRGLYYRGWPLSKALGQATGQVLADMRRDAPKLRAELDERARWFRAYGFQRSDELRSPSAAGPLVQALRDPSAAVRGRAARALGGLGPAVRDGALSPISFALADADAAVRREAMLALVRLRAHAPATRRLLARVALEERDPEQRRIGLDAVRQLQFQELAASCPPALADLVEGVGAYDSARRTDSVHSLGQIGPAVRPALPALVAALDDDASAVRRAALDALLALRIFDPAVRRALERLSRSDPDPELRGLAARLVRLLSP
jgi:hypothetical protein